MAAVNHEDTILRAYICSLVSSGMATEEAKELASKHVNQFKRAEIVAFKEEGGIDGSVLVEKLAEYVAGKYLSPLSSFIEEAKSKKTLHELDVWWQKHQHRAHLNLSEAEFNDLAMKSMPELRANFSDSEPEQAGKEVSSAPAQEETAGARTDLIIDVRPDDLSVVDNLSEYASLWVNKLKRTKALVPQTESDLKVFRDVEKECKDVEKKLDDFLKLVVKYLEDALKGDPEAEKYANKLIEKRETLEKLREETRRYRLDISKVPKEWLNEKKAAAVKEHLQQVENFANGLFIGSIEKAKDTSDVKNRLTAAYKSKRTVETVFSAVETEADLIVSEMQERAARCNANLKLIAESGCPTLFQDQDSLMLWETDRLEQEIKLRLQADDLAKARAVRMPEELARWKRTIDGITTIPHLDNWYHAHWAEVKKSMPHEDDKAELLEYCGVRKNQLAQEYARSVNEPPPPDDDPVRPPVQGNSQGEGDVNQDPPTKEDAHPEQHGAKKGLYVTFKVTVPSGDKELANTVFGKIWKLVQGSGCIPEVVEKGEVDNA